MDIPWAHILERAFIHIGWSPWTIMGFTYGFWYLGRKKPRWKLSGPWRYLVPYMASLLVIIPREAVDVWKGGHIVKSAFDMVEWAVALFLAGLVLRWYVRHFPED
ncbi:hypothetical protein LCGC14_2331520 [marine sediment metagenome]|uniref:Uncharacterized protein n=1 Tax=marine sediment metagenome TaxID=412755 RepID=A0A0F9CFG1_9ZZZZ